MPKPAAPRGRRADAPRPHHQIVSLEVTGGFLDGARLDFTDGLNCIIGGRGTGKTTTLELMRYALAHMPDPKVSPERARVLDGLVKANLKNGHVRLVVQTKDGTRYTTQRSWGEAAVVLDAKGTALPITLDRNLLFNCDVYSLNEIEEIATTPALQLQLLDRFVDEEVRGLNAEVRKIALELEENATQLVRLESETADLSATASDATLIEEKLKNLEASGGADADRINAGHVQKALREKEARALTTVQQELVKIAAEFEATATSVGRRLESRVERELVEGSNGDVFRDVVEDIHGFGKALRSFASELKSRAREAETSLAQRGRTLAKRHATQEHEYRELVAQSEEASERATERSQLNARHLEVTTARSELSLKRKEFEEREARRHELVERLSDARRERFHLRKTTAERLTKDLKTASIRVSVQQEANRARFRDLLLEALKLANMRQGAFVDQILEQFGPEELAHLVRAERIKDIAEGACGEDRARKLVNALKGTKLLYEIETIQPEDLPRIELQDGPEHKDSAKLSTGQRCTAILPILLLATERPLLVDQPEDNLDNAFIFETIVKTVRDSKRHRQLIFVTHNPNIPVLGDAERVFVLGSDGMHGSVNGAGTVDELKASLETILEGGREAFEERRKRYGRRQD